MDRFWIEKLQSLREKLKLHLERKKAFAKKADGSSLDILREGSNLKKEEEVLTSHFAQLAEFATGIPSDKFTFRLEQEKPYYKTADGKIYFGPSALSVKEPYLEFDPEDVRENISYIGTDTSEHDTQEVQPAGLSIADNIYGKYNPEKITKIQPEKITFLESHKFAQSTDVFLSKVSGVASFVTNLAERYSPVTQESEPAPSFFVYEGQFVYLSRKGKWAKVKTTVVSQRDYFDRRWQISPVVAKPRSVPDYESELEVEEIANLITDDLTEPVVSSKTQRGMGYFVPTRKIGSTKPVVAGGETQLTKLPLVGSEEFTQDVRSKADSSGEPVEELNPQYVSTQGRKLMKAQAFVSALRSKLQQPKTEPENKAVLALLPVLEEMIVKQQKTPAELSPGESEFNELIKSYTQSFAIAKKAVSPEYAGDVAYTRELPEISWAVQADTLGIFARYRPEMVGMQKAMIGSRAVMKTPPSVMEKAALGSQYDMSPITGKISQQIGSLVLTSKEEKEDEGTGIAEKLIDFAMETAPDVFKAFKKSVKIVKKSYVKIKEKEEKDKTDKKKPAEKEKEKKPEKGIVPQVLDKLVSGISKDVYKKFGKLIKSKKYLPDLSSALFDKKSMLKLPVEEDFLESLFTGETEKVDTEEIIKKLPVSKLVSPAKASAMVEEEEMMMAARPGDVADVIAGTDSVPSKGRSAFDNMFKVFGKSLKFSTDTISKVLPFASSGIKQILKGAKPEKAIDFVLTNIKKGAGGISESTGSLMSGLMKQLKLPSLESVGEKFSGEVGSLSDSALSFMSKTAGKAMKSVGQLPFGMGSKIGSLVAGGKDWMSGKLSEVTSGVLPSLESGVSQAGSFFDTGSSELVRGIGSLAGKSEGISESIGGLLSQGQAMLGDGLPGRGEVKQILPSVGRFTQMGSEMLGGISEKAPVSDTFSLVSSGLKEISLPTSIPGIVSGFQPPKGWDRPPFEVGSAIKKHIKSSVPASIGSLPGKKVKRLADYGMSVIDLEEKVLETVPAQVEKEQEGAELELDDDTLDAVYFRLKRIIETEQERMGGEI